MIKFLKTLIKLSFVFGLLIIGLVLGFCIYSLTILKVDLNMSLISDNCLNIKVYNAQNLPLKENNTYNISKVNIKLLPEYVKQSFISIEDKDFYNHNGISPKRMASAFVNNIKEMDLVEGASTITQQLIKNTHLSNKKTFSRKINEISLALQLEKKFSKDEILENYLNFIYFGNNCYGIENASQYYFSKKSKDLSLNETATLAGVIKSPSIYSPTRNQTKCISRRNIVLEEMYKDGYITQQEKDSTKQEQLFLNINKTQKNKLNSYSQCAIDEAKQILNLNEKQIAVGEYNIYTFQDLDKQAILENAINNYNIDNDFACLDVDIASGGVTAFLGKSNYKILSHKRQPASTIKPILIYAPAFNENIISPATMINDEKFSIGNYTPQNVNQTNVGNVSVREALSKSINIPAVKIATYLGLNKIQTYANRFNLELDKNDLNYSLALGGMTYGLTLKDIVKCYTTFANNGYEIQPKFVNYITNKDGKIIYKSQKMQTSVIREDTAYLVTDILKTCAKTGTAKKLSDLDFEVASKTGTVGTKSGNTDAYNISYTSQNVVGIWFGNMDNTKINTVGGNTPTKIVKDYLSQIYKEQSPANFNIPSSIEVVDIDTNELEINQNIIKANDLTLPINKTSEVFSRFNLPRENPISKLNLETPKLNGMVKDKKAILSFNASQYLVYNLYCEVNAKKTLIKTISNQNGFIEIFTPINKNIKYKFYLESNLYDKSLSLINTCKSNIVELLDSKQNIANTTTNTKDRWYI